LICRIVPHNRPRDDGRQVNMSNIPRPDKDDARSEWRPASLLLLLLLLQLVLTLGWLWVCR
jgi:hypothetical protein